MIKSKSDESSRRTLFFPAIRPCESVSLSCLLSSLIKITHSISALKSRTFISNRKNAINSIHLVETLLVFLEEIPIGTSKLETSMVLCLSELHFIFQKIIFLLEDCSRDGARLWMLMKSEQVSTHFRVLMRAVVVALDVLPLSELEMDFEVKELVELVRKQALKTQFDVQKEDRRAVRRVIRIMDHFEGGIAPESSDLKRVLAHLGIRSWNESNKEIKFLEDEIEQECRTREKRDVGFLRSLMAFLIYCRCTLFLNGESVRSSVSLQSGTRLISSDRMVVGLNPDEFSCPISLEIMIDPVTLSTGHTYDRSSILKWFESGKHTCPKTGEKLISVNLVQNLALKGIIKQHCRENGIPFEESNGRSNRSLDDGGRSVVAEQAMALLATFLVGKLVVGENEEKNKAAFEMRLLTKTSVFNRSCLVEANAIPPLLNLISSTDHQDNAMAVLLNLSKYPKGKGIIVENEGLEQIVQVLNEGAKMEARQHAAGAMFYLSSNDHNRRAIGGIPGAIPGLIELIRDGSARAKKNAMMAILGLLMYPENHWRALGDGLVLLLVNLLRSSEREDLTTASLAIIAALCEKPNGSMAIMSAGILHQIVEMLNSSNSRAAKEYIVSILLSLCINGGANVVPVLATNTSLMVSLYSLIARSSKKACSLINILHAYNEKTFMASTPSQEHIVRVW